MNTINNEVKTRNIPKSFRNILLTINNISYYNECYNIIIKYNGIRYILCAKEKDYNIYYIYVQFKFPMKIRLSKLIAVINEYKALSAQKYIAYIKNKNVEIIKEEGIPKLKGIINGFNKNKVSEE